MNIPDMHIYFRQYAQQMGMQNVNFILPEQIDIFINTGILDIVNQLVQGNVVITSNGTSQSNTKIGEINSLHTLYKSQSISLGTYTEPIANKVVIDDLLSAEGVVTPKVNGLFLVGLSVQYKLNGEDTDLFPVRLIDNQYAGHVIRDAISKPTIESPVATFSDNKLTVYFGKNAASGNGKLSEDKICNNNLIVSYIKKPNKVSYSDTINCDLPEATHINVIKRAVDLYRLSVMGQTLSNQNQRPQGTESARNQADNNNSYQQ